MRVHFKNVIANAIERGVVNGYNEIANKKTNVDGNIIIDTILKEIWEALDDIINFNDEDDDETHSHPIGFTTPAKEPTYTEAIGFPLLDDKQIGNDNDDEDEDDDGIVPLDI